MPSVCKGTPIPTRKVEVRKKHPIGTPALPTAAKVEIKIHRIICPKENVMPWPVETKSTVIRIKAAHPFMLMTEQRGRLNFEVFSESFRRFWAH